MTKFSENRITCEIKGKGRPIVLLHGYLETRHIWNYLSGELSGSYTVICPDLPGSGDSRHQPGQSVESMAEAVSSLLKELSLARVFLFGHSMGGYVSLAFAGLFPEMLSGLGLLHSHPFADTPEKKKQRQSEIEIVKQGKKALLIKTALPNFFSPEFLADNKLFVDEMIARAVNFSGEGVISCLGAMMNRSSRLDVLKNAPFPVMIAAGRKDQLIPFGMIEEISREIPEIKVTVLENSGHSGMAEEPEEMLKIIREFVES